MDLQPLILIADRNRHVREFLRRELEAEGYRVELARDGHEVWRRLKEAEPPDLLILDPETPYVGELGVLEGLKEHQPALPVVIYTLEEGSAPALETQGQSVCLEKENTDRLKAAIAVLLRQKSVHRLPSR